MDGVERRQLDCGDADFRRRIRHGHTCCLGECGTTSELSGHHRRQRDFHRSRRCCGAVPRANTLSRADTVAISGANTDAVSGADTNTVAESDALAFARTDTVAVSRANTDAVSGADTVTVTESDALAFARTDTVTVSRADASALTRTVAFPGASLHPVAEPAEHVDRLRRRLRIQRRRLCRTDLRLDRHR